MDDLGSLRRVDFSKLKTKDKSKASLRSADDTDGIHHKDGAFLSKPTKETTEGLFSSLIDQGGKGSPGGIFEDVHSTSITSKPASYGLFDAPRETEPAAPTTTTSKAPRAPNAVDDSKVDDLMVGKVLQREDGLDALFGGPSAVRPKGYAPPTTDLEPRAQHAAELFGTDQEVQLLEKLQGSWLVDDRPREETAEEEGSAKGHTEEDGGKVEVPASRPQAKVDDDLLSMLGSGSAAGAKAEGGDVQIDEHFDFGAYISKHS